MIAQILEWVSNPMIAAIIAVVAPLLLSKVNPTVAKLLYTLLAAIGIKIPQSISDNTWKGLGMESHAPDATEQGLTSLDELLGAARTSLQAGNTENAREIAELFSKRASSIMEAAPNASKK